MRYLTGNIEVLISAGLTYLLVCNLLRMGLNANRSLLAIITLVCHQKDSVARNIIIHNFGNSTMDELPKRDVLLAELARERSIRRTVRLLYDKRSRIIDELDRLISHLSLLVAVPRKTSEDPQPESEILIEAAKRINDPVFTNLLIQIIQERQK